MRLKVFVVLVLLLVVVPVAVQGAAEMAVRALIDVLGGLVGPTG